MHARKTKEGFETESENDRSKHLCEQRGMSAPTLYKTEQCDGSSDYSFDGDNSRAEDETTEELRSRLLAPKDFDAMADRIVSRVKMDLNGGRTDSCNREMSGRERAVDADCLNVDSSSNMSSHHCAACTQVMVSDQSTKRVAGVICVH